MTAIVALAGIAVSGCRAAESVAPAAPLRIGTIERSIAPGEVHRYTVQLHRARALALELEQVGIDLELSAEGPGSEPLTIDNPRVFDRPETLVWVARRSGPVTVSVRPIASDGPAGSYRLRAEAPRPASREDFAAGRGYRWYQTGRREEAASRPVRAIAAFSRAATLFRQAGRDPPEAWAWHKVGNLSLDAVDDPARAEEAFARAVELERRAGGGPALASALNSLARATAHSRTDYYRAASYYQEAREILDREGIEGGDRELRVLIGEATAQAWIGHVHLAIELFQRARKTAIALNDKDGECRALFGLSRTLRRSGDSQGALEAANACRDAARAVLPAWHASMLGELGGIQLDLEHPQLALKLLLDARAVDGSVVSESRWHQDVGRAYGRLGRLREAEEAFAVALERSKSAGEREKIHLDRAYAINRAGDPESALEICQEVQARAFEESDPLAVAGSHYCIGLTLEALGRPLEALEHAQAAVGQVESLRTGLVQDRLRSLFLASKREYYELVIRLLLDLGDGGALGRTAESWWERSFEVAEASKARTLLEGLSRGEAETSDDFERLERKRELEEEIAVLELDLLAGRAGGVGAPGRDPRLEELRRKHQDLDFERGALRAGRPGWRDANALDTARVAEIREVLLSDGETAIVSYFLGAEESYVWVLGRETIAVRRLPPGGKIEQSATQMADRMAKARAPHELAQAEADSAALAELVLEPIADVLASLTAERLIFVPEGALLEVPFAALRIGRSSAAFDLQSRFVLAQAHSGSTALALRRERAWRPSTNGRVAVLGDPVFGCDDSRLTRSVACAAVAEAAADVSPGGSWALDLTDLPRLRASGREAERIAERLSEDDPLLLLGFDARVDRLLAGELSAFRILHFATHGFSNAAASGLVLSRFDAAGREIDGVLREWQVYDLRLAADLVVLSACRSGRGARLTGEGAASLSRAFLWAGASTVVVSLWNVDDGATAFLMDRFYTELSREGVTPAVALGLAQGAVRARPEWSAPRYWAGFVVQGDWR